MPHRHWYSACEQCGLFCNICGAPWDRPLSEATFTVQEITHFVHAGWLYSEKREEQQ